MLSQTTILTVISDGFNRELTITPLFLQNDTQSWEPNEIFELVETGKIENDVRIEYESPIELGKIIISDHKDWRYEGDSDLNDGNLNDIAEFLINTAD